MATLFYPKDYHIDGRPLYGPKFARCQRVPFLLSRDLTYVDEVNRFLREVADGTWHPGPAVSAYGRSGRLPSDNTMRAKGSALENFWSYIEARKLDWRSVDYDTLLTTYDEDMGNGSWSADGQPLSASTINGRVGVVCEFLTWASEEGHRDPFVVRVREQTREVRAGRRSRRQLEVVEVRAGRRRPDPKRLRLPSLDEIEAWLAEVEARRGPTKALACRTVLATNMRLEECAHIRVFQLQKAIQEMECARPNACDTDRFIRLNICYGTKGGRAAGDPDLKGKPRSLIVRPHFLHRLERYATKFRPFALHRFKSRKPDAAVPTRLFLSELDGEPLSKASIYKAWHECRRLPFPGWSPHAGRHAWACYTLLDHVRREREFLLASASSNPVAMALASQLAQNFVDTVLRPAMGHIDEETTQIYIGWVEGQLSSGNLHLGWSSFLEGSLG